MANDFLGNLGNAIGNGFNKVTREVGREVSRIGAETIENVNKDADQIATGVKRGGLFGGVLEGFDVFSPGHQVANGLDALNVIPENKALQEAISAGVNLGVGAIPGGQIFQLAAIKDAADAIGAMGVAGSPAAMPASQDAVSPHEARRSKAERKHDAIETAKAKARERAESRHHARDGYGTGSVSSGIGCSQADIIRNFGEMLSGGSATEGGSDVDAEEDKMLKELKRILNTPGLMFEDMIFMLMRAVIKGTQKQARALSKELTGNNTEGRTATTSERTAVQVARQKLGEAQSGGDPKKISDAQATLATAEGKLEDGRAERQDSRTEKMEQLKEMLSKLSEMQQALSNILNSQHETAMAAIRNIR